MDEPILRSQSFKKLMMMDKPTPRIVMSPTQRVRNYFGRTIFYKTVQIFWYFSSNIFWFRNFIFRPISFSEMVSSMFRLRNYFKVFNSIIKFITINMMNNFFWERFKFSSKMFLHHKPMFKNSIITSTSSTSRNFFITTFCKLYFSNRITPTQFRTIFLIRKISFVFFIALKTGFSHRNYYTMRCGTCQL